MGPSDSILQWNPWRNIYIISLAVMADDQNISEAPGLESVITASTA